MGKQRQSWRKRLFCGGMGFVFAIPAATFFFFVSGGEIFIILAAISGFLSGTILFPRFISDTEVCRKSLWRGLFGGVLSTLFAIFIGCFLFSLCLELLLGSLKTISFTQFFQLDFIKFFFLRLNSALLNFPFAVIFLSPFAIPSGMLGGVVTQMLWRCFGARLEGREVLNCPPNGSPC